MYRDFTIVNATYIFVLFVILFCFCLLLPKVFWRPLARIIKTETYPLGHPHN